MTKTTNPELSFLARPRMRTPVSVLSTMVEDRSREALELHPVPLSVSVRTCIDLEHASDLHQTSHRVCTEGKTTIHCHGSTQLGIGCLVVANSDRHRA